MNQCIEKHILQSHTFIWIHFVCFTHAKTNAKKEKHFECQCVDIFSKKILTGDTTVFLFCYFIKTLGIFNRTNELMLGSQGLY